MVAHGGVVHVVKVLFDRMMHSADMLCSVVKLIVYHYYSATYDFSVTGLVSGVSWVSE